MSVNCVIYLPPAARLTDVSKVIAILDGCPATKYIHSKEGDDREVWWTNVPDVKTQDAHTPECAQILWTTNGKKRSMLYHFELGKKGEHGITPGSTGWAIALGKRLVDFFGGYVDFNDCDEIEVDYKKRAKWDIHGEDGPEWDHLQSRMLALKPLTKEEIQEATKVSGYQEDGVY